MVALYLLLSAIVCGIMQGRRYGNYLSSGGFHVWESRAPRPQTWRAVGPPARLRGIRSAALQWSLTVWAGSGRPEPLRRARRDARACTDPISRSAYRNDDAYTKRRANVLQVGLSRPSTEVSRRSIWLIRLDLLPDPRKPSMTTGTIGPASSLSQSPASFPTLAFTHPPSGLV